MSKPWEAKSPTAPLPDIAAALREAEACRASGRFAEAEMLCRRVLAVWPGNPEALHIMGLLALAHGNLELATDYVRTAGRSPSAPAAYFSNLAEIYRQRRLYAEGERAARKAVAMAPAMPGAWNNLGIILQEAGRLDEARQCLERVLELQPDNAEAHNNLANTLRRLMEFKSAERHWKRALDLRPDYPEALGNMVVLLTEQGNYRLAEEYGLRAIRLNPRLADAYVNLAALAAACNNHTAALELLDRVMSFAPDHPDGLAGRAQALRHLERNEEALAVARRAVAAAPERPELHNAVGSVLQALGRYDEAMAEFGQAAEAPGRSAEGGMLGRVRLLMEYGHTREAKAAAETVIARFPESPAAWNGYVDLKTFKRGDADIGRMEALLDGDAGDFHGQRMMLHFALGKAYLDAGDSDKAFEHLNAGNGLKRSVITYDSAANTKWMDSIATTFSGELMARFAGHGAASRRPIFVLGMPRSGTTLVEQILASHSMVKGAGELKFVHRVAAGNRDFPKQVPVLPPTRLEDMGQAYLAAIEPLSDGHERVVDKMPSNFLYAGMIRLMLPEAQIIHCRRNPVDTCLSCYSKIFADEQSFTYDMGELGAYHRAYQRLMAHWRELLPASHFLEVDYESVVEDAEGQTRRMLDYLGLGWEDACLQFYRNDRPVRTASVNQVRKPVYRSSAGRWRKHARNLAPLLEALELSGEA